jgi:hypothetical protein
VGISGTLNNIRRRKLRKPKKTLAEALSAFGVIGGVVFFFLCVVYVVVAYWVVGILAGISQKDYTPANQRVAAYEKFFHGLEKKGLDVKKSPPYIKDGAKYFLWTVTVPKSSDRLIYRWEHDLETNRVSPLTSPATYLDIELKYVKPDEASNYPYEPGDPIALQMAQGEYEPLETYAMPEPSKNPVGEPAAGGPSGQPMPYQNPDTSGGGEEGGGGDAAPPADESGNGGETAPPADGSGGGEATPPADGSGDGGDEAKPGDGEKPKDEGGEAKPKDGEGGDTPPKEEKPKDEPPKEGDDKPKDGEGGKDDSVPVK